MNKLQFLDECRFAKVVTTSSGPGILVGGTVFTVSAPDGLEFDATEAVALALRNSQYVGLPTGQAGGAGVGFQGFSAINPNYFGQVGKAAGN